MGEGEFKVIRAKLPFQGFTYLNVSTSKLLRTPGISATCARPRFKISFAVWGFFKNGSSVQKIKTTAATLRWEEFPKWRSLGTLL
jgi:hypothetical protein